MTVPVDENAVNDRLLAGTEAFNRGDYFESHDLLEDLWMDVRGRERLFFQGLIQVAIGCYHVTCENESGARHLLERGLRKLSDWTPAYRTVDVAALVSEVEAVLAALVTGQESVDLPRIRKAAGLV